MKKSPLFFVWILSLATVILAAGWGYHRGVKVETDFLSVFPKYQERGTFYAANAVFEERFARELVWFVRAPSLDQALDGARTLYERMRAEDLFASSTFEVSTQDFGDWIGYLYQHRSLLLTAEQRDLVESGQAASLVNQALADLYSPAGSTMQLSSDPLNLFRAYLTRAVVPTGVKPERGALVVHDADGSAAVMIRTQLNKNAADFDARLVKFYRNAKALGADLRVHALGVSLFSAVGSEGAMSELSIYGTLSFLGVLVLLVASFSSVVPVIFSFLTVVVSVATGLVAAFGIFSSVHVLSILLGISVLGVVTDYCTHFFAKAFDEHVHSNAEVFAKIKGALAIGLLTNVLIYLCFYFTDFPILKQLAVFTIAGVVMAYLTVIALFPLLPFRPLRAHHLARVARLSSFWKRWGRARALGAMALLCAGLVVASGGFRFDDDVRLLQAVDVDLRSDELKVREYLGISASPFYFVVRGENAEDLLRHEEALTAELRGSGYASMAVSSFVPSEEAQRESGAAYAKLGPYVKDFLSRLKARVTPPPLSATESFSVESFLSRFPSFPLASQWLGHTGDAYYSVVNVHGKNPEHAVLAKAESPAAHLVGKARDLSDFLRSLRETIMGQFALVIALLAMFLVFVFGWRQALLVLFPPLVASLGTLSLAMITAGHLNLFHVLAVIMIFCLGMDYSVFFARSRGSTLATHVGVFISVISTIGSFGVLALSGTHAVSSFGLSVFVGIGLCYLISPMVAPGDADA
ncbi:MAG TPA: MMPL family transporter [Bdellovibrionota bacterium]|nr:MMPL family transporter [Bdellovibrionota bacterium]